MPEHSEILVSPYIKYLKDLPPSPQLLMEFDFLSGCYPMEFKTQSVDTTLVVERLAVERNREVLRALPPFESFLEF